MCTTGVPVSPRERGVDVLLGSGVGPEVDGARGRHANNVGAEALVEAADALGVLYVPVSGEHFKFVAPSQYSFFPDKFP